MTLLIISFIAGILTVLAPCVLPLLPVIVGSSVVSNDRKRSYVIIGSLIVSVVLFTLLLKASTAFIAVPQSFWQYVSGILLIILSASLLFPETWARIPVIGKITIGANRAIGTGYQKKNFWGDVLIGVSLGPVFSTCSPTYFIILATVLPVHFGLGLIYLLAYAFGLGLILLAIAIFGDRLVKKLGKVSDGNGWFKKGLGIILIIVGVTIITGFDKKIETALLDSKILGVTSVEERLLHSLDTQKSNEKLQENKETMTDTKKLIKNYGPYHEIVNPSGFVNTNGEPITLSQYIGDKVVLVDFMTYSCINCQRTFPYLVAWDKKYRDVGLQIVGIHTPEFAFEKNSTNVQKSMQQFGIQFPVVLDNDYGTWRSYENNYWPRKYIIDTDGTIVYDHIGEGNYDETEIVIRELLTARAKKLGIQINLPPLENVTNEKVATSTQSPETYLGTDRNEYQYSGMGKVPVNHYQLLGKWDRTGEYTTAVTDAVLKYHFDAGKVFLVASSFEPKTMTVFLDGKPIVTSDAGADVKNGLVTVDSSRLYELVHLIDPGKHILELRVDSGIQVYAFTFG